MLILRELSNQRQFVVYALVPKPEKPGKFDKIPVDPFRGYADTYGRINGQDSANWLLPDEAELYASGLSGGGAESYGVGIVLHERCGIAAIDLDSCREPSGGWQPHVAAFLAMFPGSYFEASVSRTGGHILVGYTGELPAHGTRNSDYRAEAYSKERFIAIGEYLTGSVLVDNGERLREFLTAYFPPRDEDTAAEWSNSPVERWHGPSDDGALIQRAMRSRSAQATFGRGASFSDLFTANADALGRAFPAQSASSPWDGSGADLALANHLAFWTGNDCERMARLMLQSGLVRDKWQRTDYFRGTILRACASQREWYNDGTPTTAPASPEALPPSTTPTLQNVAVAIESASGTAPAQLPPLAQVPAPPPGAQPGALAVSAFTLRINGKGMAEATLENLVFTLSEQSKWKLGFDIFRGRVMIAQAEDLTRWTPLTDNHMVHMRETMARELNYAAIGKDLMRDAVGLVADRYQFDSAHVWLDSLVWDGQPRARGFMHYYCGTPNDEYSAAVSEYIWSGLACRVFEPGCQLDMVVAMFSPQQGLYKSSALAEMVPDTDFFTDSLDLHKDDDDFKRKIKGKLVCEIAEMAGMSTAAVEYVKRVITRRREEWIEKWQTLPTVYARRAMLFATTNEEQFLPKDDSGQRRWLPNEITRINRDMLRRDREQLWAEGAAMYRERKAQGLPGVIFENAETLAKGKHSRHEQGDVWENLIGSWLTVSGNTPNGEIIPPPAVRPFSIDEVLLGALLMNKDKMDVKSEKRVGRVLRQLGYAPMTVRINSVPLKRWVKR